MADEIILFHQDNAPCHKSPKIMAKLDELKFRLVPHQPYSPDLAPSDYWLFADLRKILAGKKFRTNDEIIREIEAYFDEKDTSFFKNGIEMLEWRWSTCIALEGEYLDE